MDYGIYLMKHIIIASIFARIIVQMYIVNLEFFVVLNNALSKKGWEHVGKID
jgi:hypothetical protein